MKISAFFIINGLSLQDRKARLIFSLKLSHFLFKKPQIYILDAFPLPLHYIKEKSNIPVNFEPVWVFARRIALHHRVHLSSRASLTCRLQGMLSVLGIKRLKEKILQQFGISFCFSSLPSSFALFYKTNVTCKIQKAVV